MSRQQRSRWAEPIFMLGWGIDLFLRSVEL